MSDKKFINVSKHPGIRKSSATGRYQALKKIKGKQYSEMFDSIRDAIHWKNTFDGTKPKPSGAEAKSTATFGEVWLKMKEIHFPTVQPNTRQVWETRFFHLSNLVDMHMEDFSPSVITDWIEKKKTLLGSEEYRFKVGGGAKYRCNLHNELRLFTLIFNWYRDEKFFENESKSIFCPIRPRHRTMAIIRDTAKKTKDKKIPPEDAFKFFSAIKYEVYRDLAIVQYFIAGRIGETAGIQIKNIDLDRDIMKISESAVWNQHLKTFWYLKPLPKNNEAREVFLHPELKDAIIRRLKHSRPECDFLFHINGKPLDYSLIQIHYRNAQRLSGIKYTGTHCLRHGMATLARRVGGGLDATMAMTGHKDRDLADHYSEVEEDLQKVTSLKIVDHLRQAGLSLNSSKRPAHKAKKNEPKVLEVSGMMDAEIQQKVFEYVAKLLAEKQSASVMSSSSTKSILEAENVVPLFKVPSA